MLVPRRIIRPRVRFSSTASAAAAEPGAAGAEDLAVRLRVLRNSSVSARTRFMCFWSCQFGAHREGICVGGGGETYFVESEHLPCHLSAIVECYPHAVVDEVLHLALFVRHDGGGAHECDLRRGLWRDRAGY